MKTLGMVSLTAMAMMAMATPVLAHGGGHGGNHGGGNHNPAPAPSTGNQSRTYHYPARSYQNGGSGFSFRSYGRGVDTRNGYNGPNTSISRPHRAAWNAYIRREANRDAVSQQTMRPDCGMNRSPLDCRVMPRYETVVVTSGR